MRGCLFFGAVETGAFQNYVYADFSPRKINGVFLRINLDGLSVYGYAVFTRYNRLGILISALSGIVLQKVSKHFGACQIVDSYDFVTFRVKHLPKRKTAYTTETVDSNFYISHKYIPPNNKLLTCVYRVNARLALPTLSL